MLADSKSSLASPHHILARQKHKVSRIKRSHRSIMTARKYMFVVEHMDPELEDWQAIEYKCIAKECLEAGTQFLLTSVSPNLKLPALFEEATGLQMEQRTAETIFANRKDRVCLLDPAASKELNHMDGDKFEIFLFGGILGTSSACHGS